MPSLRAARFVLVAVLAASGAASRVASAAPDADAAAPTRSEVVPPRLVADPGARFPDEARREGLFEVAPVHLVLTIDATGAVKEASVATPYGHGFDEAALEAARAMRFEPATRARVPVAVRIAFVYEVRPPPPRLVGRVKRAADDGPLAGARVVATDASGVERVATSDADGVWAIVDASPGKVRVVVSAEGLEPAIVDDALVPGEEARVEARLVVGSVQQGEVATVARGDVVEVTVRGEPPTREVTKRTLSQRELSRIPGTNGDALRAIQAMPGVARSPAARGLLIVRGSAPADTAIFVDGIAVPIVYHFGGLSSVVPTEMIERLDFVPGNFSARYGRAMGGIVEVTTLGAPAEPRWHGLAQADFIDARTVLQGPIPFAPRWSLVVAARRSYVDLWLRPLSSRASGGGTTAAPVYYDWQAFAETHPTSSSRFRVGIFGSDDRLSVVRTPTGGQSAAAANDLESHTGFGRVQASYEAEIGTSGRARTTLAYGWDVQSFQGGTRSLDTTRRPLVSRSELTLELSPWLDLHLGEDLLYTQTRVDVTRPAPRRPGEPDPGPATDQQSLTERDSPSFFYPAVYAEANVRPHPRVGVVPGVRIDWASSTHAVDVAPRVNARWDVVAGRRRTTLKGGVGLFYQPPQPEETSPVFGTPGLSSNRAIHASLGVEHEFGPKIDVSIEGFYKDLSRLVTRAPASSGYAYANDGTGTVVGSEMLLRYRADERFFGWIAYTLSRSVRTDAPGKSEHLFQYDQTHIFTALASHRIGGGWEIGARFRYVSGNPFTPCAGGVENGATGSYVCVAGATYSQRLPAYHELDVRIDKHWYYEAWQLSAYLDLLNAYNRANPEGITYNFDFSQHLYQTGLPIIPSLGIRGDF